MVFAPSLRKKKFVSLGRTVVKFCHTASLFSRGLCVLNPKNKTHDGLLFVRDVARSSSLWIRYGVNMSNEMPTVLVGLVHLHDCAFVNEGLLFFGKSVRLAGIKWYEEGRHDQQNAQFCFASSHKYLSHRECSGQR
jgi:hypothetical protein